MIQKLKSKAGMTLMEVMVSLLIMVLLVVGMGTGMDAGMRVYADAHFESSSASLAGIINTALSDVLRYAQDIETPSAEGAPSFVFTNLEYGLRDSYFQCNEDGVLQICFWTESGNPSAAKALINTGAYSGLKIKDGSFTIQYCAGSGTITKLDNSTAEIKNGNVFYIRYTISNADDKSRDVETVVRVMNS